MSRIICKICRRLGESICGRQKCAYKKKPYPPGKLASEKKHRSVRSEYGGYLIEKQKVRNTYGVSEKQFSNYVKNVQAKKRVSPSEALYDALERRLDNVVYRLGLASTRALARQMVSHGHITVNTRKVTIPSYSLAVGDKISVREGSKTIVPFKDLKERLEKHPIPSWLKVNPEEATAEVEGKPKGGDLVFNWNSVIEFYSR